MGIIKMNMSSPFYCDSRHILCSVCKNYLSCGPILIRKQRRVICGRCVIKNEIGIRNRAYEVAAARLRFPCKYREFGCRETQAFAQSYKLSHEYSCDFRTYKCKFADNICFWEGSKQELIKHCERNHVDRLILNCCTLDINLLQVSSASYLLIAFEKEFVLYMKQSLQLITFELEFLGKQEASTFKYKVNIQGPKSIITYTGDCEKSVETDKNILNDVFATLEEIKFHITIFIICEICEKDVFFGKLYNIGTKWLCSDCSPKLKMCRNKNNGCNFEDLTIKIIKHQEYFCNHTPLESFFNIETIGLNHIDYGKIWLIKSNYNKSAIATDIGIVIAEFTSKRDPQKFEIFIYSYLKSNDEKDFSCKVYVANPFSNESETIIANFNIDKVYDWYVSIDKLKHPSWGSELIVLLFIQRVPPSIRSFRNEDSVFN